MFKERRTSIPQTSETSSAVGAILNNTDCKTKVIPLREDQHCDLKTEMKALCTWFLDRLL